MFVQVANFLFSLAKQIFDSISTSWGVIGFGILSTFLFARVINFIRRFFR